MKRLKALIKFWLCRHNAAKYDEWLNYDCPTCGGVFDNFDERWFLPKGKK